MPVNPDPSSTYGASEAYKAEWNATYGGSRYTNPSAYAPGALISGARDQANLNSAALSTNAYGYLPPRCVIPPNTRVVIDYGAWFACSAAGVGAVGVGVAETSTGVLTQISFSTINGTFASTGTFAPLIGQVHGSIDLDPLPTWRYLRMIGSVFRDSGSLAAVVLKSKTGSTSHDRSPYVRVRTA